jgi:hypothetical protein
LVEATTWLSHCDDFERLLSAAAQHIMCCSLRPLELIWLHCTVTARLAVVLMSYAYLFVLHPITDFNGFTEPINVFTAMEDWKKHAL